MRVEIPYTEVFERNRNATKKVVVNRGGSGASKSYSLGQLFMSRFLGIDGVKILVVRKTMPAMRLSTYMLWDELLEKFGVSSRMKHEKQAWNFRYRKSLIHFGSVDDPEKIKSTWWNYIWMEESNEFTYEDYRILRLRLTGQENGFRNQIVLSFNPVSAFHWIKTDLVDKDPDLEEIVSTYRDNPFLSEDYVRDIEALKDQDPNFWAIYGLGEWGQLTGLIYTNWDAVDTFPENLDEFYGLDFGFNNPSVLVRLGRKEEEIWEEELIYQGKLTTPELISLMKERIPEGKRDLPIYADPEDPKAIEEIFNAGFNIHPADNSVREGVDHVKRFKTHLLKGNENGIKEKRAYAWAKDKNGNSLEKPVKFLDHYQDAERYGIYSHLNQVLPGIYFVKARSAGGNGVGIASLPEERKRPKDFQPLDPWFLGE